MLKRKLILLAAVLVCSGAATPPPKRIALVIGNGTYSYADPLPNAVSDAEKLRRTLSGLGFQIFPSTQDLDQSRLGKAIDDFEDELRASGPNVVSFVYYSGHAAQDAFGINYMLPVDLDPATADVVRNRGVPIASLFKAMEDANNDVNILVLDACRDWFEKDKNLKLPKGLHDMGLHGSVFIAYATRSGTTADEGPGLTSSPFSNRLIEALQKQASEPVSLVFDDVQTRVYADTDSVQLPMYVNGLVRAGRWAFSSASLDQVAETPRPAVADVNISAFLESLDRDKLISFTHGNVSFVDVLLKRRDILEKYEINTPNRLAFFIASIAFETAGFRQQVEKFGYSATALRRVFTSRIISDELARQLAGKPEAIANFVYANRFGNGPAESGDGWRYRGRSLFFITGRGNYRRYGQEIGADLENSPDLANDLETGLAIAGAVWKNQRVNVAADEDDMPGAARRFRGSSLSGDLPGRMIWLRQAKRALGIAN